MSEFLFYMYLFHMECIFFLILSKQKDHMADMEFL